MIRKLVHFAMTIVIVAFVLAALIGLYFLPNIRGYQEFVELCRTQAGAHITEKMLPGRGWQVLDERPGDAMSPLQYPTVAFVRYRAKDGQRYDLVRIPQTEVGGIWHTQQPVDPNQVPRYQFRYQTFEMESPTLLGQNRYEVIDMETNKQVYFYQEFAFSKFKPENTLFGAPSTERCPDDVSKTDPATGRPIPSLKARAFLSAFAK